MWVSTAIMVQHKYFILNVDIFQMEMACISSKMYAK